MKSSARWSRLKRDIEAIMDPKVKFQIYANSYKNGSGQSIGRFWITIDGEIIFDFPRNYMDEIKSVYYSSFFSQISQTLRNYINTSRENIFDPEFLGSSPTVHQIALLHILQVCDKRVGERKLKELLDCEEYIGVKKIISKRLGGG